MPKCERCTNSVPSYSLKCVRGESGNTQVVCANCRKPEEVLSAHPGDRQVAAISLHEYETAEGKKDYRVRAEVAHGGLDINYQFTFDEARELFKSAGKKKAELKAV